ncbi:putative CAAX prenyl protease 2 [Hypsibius exemplaris]|uniref:CAAX prenyl protease 2 n=1 Tax=Hypsibius exemplaris TaxID=2072580 RepID=A0A1W0X8T3_HYPEX|nr:putative CAAX prenyl protease 2 [Hypsibius exemplaris]
MDSLIDSSIDTAALTGDTACTASANLWAWIAGSCIAFSYVVSLYIHPFGERLLAFPQGERNDPAEIRSRFQRVFYASIFSFLVSAAYQYAFALGKLGPTTELLQILLKTGFRLVGLPCAVCIPVLLTLILFLGPLVGDYVMGRFQGYNRAFVSLFYHNRYFRRKILRDSLFSLIWWRAYVVAPISEEFVYRACLVPVILHCFGSTAAIIVSPLAFGVAHLHHIFDRIRLGASAVEAITTTLFQIFYTSLFGAYSAYLFVRTGHFIAPVLVHALCNSMGVPDVAAFKSQQRIVIGVMYFLGLFLWMGLISSYRSMVLRYRPRSRKQEESALLKIYLCLGGLPASEGMQYS